MSWVLDDYGYTHAENSDTADDITVTWRKKDDAVIGAFKRGTFDHTLDGAKLWSQNKADVAARIAADEGLITT